MPPRRIVTLGLHGSASTFVFNATRELLVATHGAAAVHPCHASRAEEFPLREARHVIAKSHAWPGLAAFARAHQVDTVISVRDPRDAMLSLMQRFGMNFISALHGIARDCNTAMACTDSGFPVLRYEDRFFEHPATVALLARKLQLDAPPETLARIFAAYTTAAVRAYAAGVAALPPAQRSGSGDFWYENVTQITSKHIGDGRQGKWRNLLDASQQAQATQVFAPFLLKYGYPA
jgi:hypothetical protein